MQIEINDRLNVYHFLNVSFFNDNAIALWTTTSAFSFIGQAPIRFDCGSNNHRLGHLEVVKPYRVLRLKKISAAKFLAMVNYLLGRNNASLRV
jgi:hypothetical protein